MFSRGVLPNKTPKKLVRKTTGRFQSFKPQNSQAKKKMTRSKGGLCVFFKKKNVARIPQITAKNDTIDTQVAYRALQKLNTQPMPNEHINRQHLLCHIFFIPLLHPNQKNQFTRRSKKKTLSQWNGVIRVRGFFVDRKVLAFILLSSKLRHAAHCWAL